MDLTCMDCHLPQVVSLDSKLPNVDPLALDVIRRCLRYEPLQRITSSELLRHPYFGGFEEWYMPVFKAALHDDNAAVISSLRDPTATDAASGTPPSPHVRLPLPEESTPGGGNIGAASGRRAPLMLVDPEDASPPYQAQQQQLQRQ